MEKENFNIIKSKTLKKNPDGSTEAEKELVREITEIRQFGFKLGEGKTAEVFFSKTDPYVCYKIITDKSRYVNNVRREQEFLDKCQLISYVKAPKPLFCIISENFEALIMEKISGYSILEIIEKNLDLPENFDFGKFYKTLHNHLDSLHSANIYHRDLRPGNIIIDKQGTPWIIDFGDSSCDFDESTAYTRRIIKGGRITHQTLPRDEVVLDTTLRDLREYIHRKKSA